MTPAEVFHVICVSEEHIKHKPPRFFWQRFKVRIKFSAYYAVELIMCVKNIQARLRSLVIDFLTVAIVSVAFNQPELNKFPHHFRNRALWNPSDTRKLRRIYARMQDDFLQSMHFARCSRRVPGMYSRWILLSIFV